MGLCLVMGQWWPAMVMRGKGSMSFGGCGGGEVVLRGWWFF
jgi:hypothetical protein